MMISIATSRTTKELLDTDLIQCARILVDGEDGKDQFYEVEVTCADRKRIFKTDSEDEAHALVDFLCQATTALPFNSDRASKKLNKPKSSMPNSDLTKNAVDVLLSHVS